MILRHYSAKEFEFDYNHEYKSAGSYKPHGFWVSVFGDDDWPTWCEGDSYGLHRLTYEYMVDLKPDANVLIIENSVDLLLFDKKLPRFPLDRGRDLEKYAPVNWEPIMREYDGLIIAPYNWSLRMELMWYYGWDCASGVIWNLDAIESITLLRVNDYTETEEQEVEA